YISKVALAGIECYSAGTEEYPYYERWDSLIPEIQAGALCSLRLSPGDYPSGNRMAAWIDYNRNGAWEPAEKLGEILVDAPAPAEGLIPFYVPGCTDTGYTLMRVRETWAVPGIDPCDAYPFGET